MKTNKNKWTTAIIMMALYLSSHCLFAQVTPKKTDDFIGSMGINIKLDRDRYKNNDGFNTRVKPAIRDLGIRHVRSSHFGHSTYGPQNRQLWENYGTRALYVTGSYEGGLTPQGVRWHSSQAADYIYAVEGQNEPDIFLVEGFGWTFQQYTDRNGNFLVNTSANYRASRAWHEDMVYYLENDPATRNLKIATTPMAFGNNVSKIVPITHDLESFHHYSHRDPITTNLDNTINQTHGYAQGGTPKPLILSEFGWRTSGSNNVTEKTQAKNILTAFCEYFNRGIKVSYIHELIDNNWGLLKSGGVRKPSFNALKNIISLLGEATFDKTNKQWIYPNFTPRSLDLQISGANSSTNHMLLQKSNGTYFLLLWRNIDRSNDNGTDKNNGNDGVTVTVNGNLSAASEFRFNSSFDLVESQLSINNGSVNVNVPDNVVIVRLNVPITSGYRKIENKSNRKVIKIDVSGGNGSAVLQHDWRDWDSQEWKFISIGGGFYKIENKQSGRVLQANDSNADGVAITQRNWNNWNPQKWKIIHVGNGYYQIVNRANGKCVRANLDGGNNTPVLQHGCQNWDSQKWKLASLSPANTREGSKDDSNSLQHETKLSEEWQIYPNPASTRLWVVHPQGVEGRAMIRVMDLSGKELFHSGYRLEQGQDEWEVNISSLPPGAYLLSLETPGETKMKRFMITK